VRGRVEKAGEASGRRRRAQDAKEVEEPIVVHRISRAWINLFEAPVLFIAEALLVAHLGIDDATFAALGLAYVALRAVHWVIIVTINIVPVRFGVFIISVFVQGAIALRIASILWLGGRATKQ
jgi:hypothetical protein